MTSTAPEISAIALPAEAGPISGTAAAKAALPTPININMLPNIFTVSTLLDEGFFEPGI